MSFSRIRRKNAEIFYTYPQLVKDTSMSSGYAEYEVKDVLQHFVWCLSQAIKLQDKPVEVKGLGRFKSTVWSARTQYSNLTKSKVELPERVSVRFSPSYQLKNYLNNEYDDDEE